MVPVNKCQLPQFDQAYESSLFHTGVSLANVNEVDNDYDNQKSDHHRCHHDLDLEHLCQHANCIDQHANDHLYIYISPGQSSSHIDHQMINSYNNHQTNDHFHI